MFVYLNQLKFIIGDWNRVLRNLIRLLNNNGDSRIILPCSLNDLASTKDYLFYKSVDLCVTDSMFLTWWFRLKYCRGGISRIYGPDLLIVLLKHLNSKNLSASFLVANESTYKLFKSRVDNQYPRIKGQFYYLLNCCEKTEKKILNKIIFSKPKIIFLGIGSPKQVELAVYLKKRLKNCTIFCVGAAFDFFSNRKKQAPLWIRTSGLEWFFRLITEPKRLWRRYLITIPKYLFSMLLKKF